MACLLKVLSDMLQIPQPLSHFHMCPKPKVKLGPTDLIYPAPPISLDIVITHKYRGLQQFLRVEYSTQIY